ncbi:MAP7 domain-containing protein 3 isoform X4 [Xenopus tropicalis]|uniref:MAP7 domain-containing protein 3 isoform X4 n=1 Tax=Xenopus tropicalis TaxID=8364 RepID=A0A8J0QI48_XENTR|nr:MAP7 domain-containing protein 3 isoform X4 [Xenopus tropicalis]
MRGAGRTPESGSTGGEGKMADGSGKLKGLREQMVAAAQAQAEERRNQSSSSQVPVQPALITKTTKPVIDGSALRTDERQRLARERREERDRLNATKETQLLEKEKKAKLQYEKQIEEKLKKLEEQRLKDEQKRAAVEEKRKQKLFEEKERREANVRRTLERSSQLDQRQKRWSWGGGSVADGDLKHGTTGNSSPSPVDIAEKAHFTTDPHNEEKDGSGGKRSTSTTNLKQAESVMHKRLSSSSATLQNPDRGPKKRSSSLSRLSNKTPLNSQPHSPSVSNLEKKGGANQKRSSSLSRLGNKPSTPPHVDNVKKEEKTAQRPPTSPLDGSIISRLLAPTQSSLARSKSAAMLSSDGKDLPASATTINTPPSVPKGPLRSRSIDRLKSPQNSSPCTGTPVPSQKSEHEKQSPPSLGKRPPSPALINSRRRSPSPANTAKRAPSPTLESKKVQKNHSSSPVATKQKTSSPSVTNKPVPIPRPSLTPNVLNAAKKSAETETKPKEKTQEILAEPKSLQTSEKENTSGTTKTKDESNCKNSSGSTTAEEAAKMLAEKRRLAREQREREEQERIQRQQEEKVKQEEMAQKAAEEKAKQIEEAKILEEKRKLETEEEQRKAEEERIQKEIELQERLAELQQQKEEAEAKALEEAEKQRQEREKIMQQNMQERLERKKRIEEIMKRTRKTDQMDARNEDRSGLEEDDEIDLIDTNMDAGLNGVYPCEESDELGKTCFMESSALTSTDPLFSDASAPEQNELFINGDKPGSVQKENAQALETVPPNEFSSHVDSDTALSSEAQPPFNEDDKLRVLVNNVNGKSGAWMFEEIFDLEIHSNSTSLSSDSVNMNLCKKSYIEDATSPGAPKLAFEDGKMNVLSTAIESAAEM